MANAANTDDPRRRAPRRREFSSHAAEIERIRRGNRRRLRRMVLSAR